MTFPLEFRRMPLFMPPDMFAPNNPAHDWLVMEDWRAPALDGKQVCVRGGSIGPDALWHGFYTDGVSVPVFAESIVNLTPFSMPEFCAALGHDIVYAAELVPRSTCDTWLYDWLGLAGVSNIRREMIYHSVDLFGAIVWARHTPESIALSRQFCQLVDVGQEPVWNDRKPEDILS
jgi:hypothetical protein